jgi:carbonic anhydrase
MVVGVQMVSLTHIRSVTRHREALVYAVTLAGVVLLGVLAGVLIGVAVAVAVALHRLARTRITVEELEDGTCQVRARGQLTFLAVPRFSRALNLIPPNARVVVELDGSFMDHAAYETLHDWQQAHSTRGGTVEITGRAGRAGPRIADPLASAHGCCRPWTPWRNHSCRGPVASAVVGASAATTTGSGQLASGLRSFQRHTAPLVRAELARLAREGQRPSQLFLTCADSRLVTSMITSSGPGDLFTVRNVGNLVPLPGAESTDDSVAAAIEYAVDVLRVGSITVCGHSGCGAMQALLTSPRGGAQTPLKRWLRHGVPSLARLAATEPTTEPGRAEAARGPWLADREPADVVEQLCLANVVQQLEHLLAHDSVARRVAEGSLELHGMYFHVGEAQAYLLADATGLFHRVGPAGGSTAVATWRGAALQGVRGRGAGAGVAEARG